MVRRGLALRMLVRQPGARDSQHPDLGEIMHARIAVCVAVVSIAGCAWVERALPGPFQNLLSPEAKAKLERKMLDEAIDRLGVVVFEVRSRMVRLAPPDKRSDV